MSAVRTPRRRENILPRDVTAFDWQSARFSSRWPRGIPLVTLPHHHSVWTHVMHVAATETARQALAVIIVFSSFFSPPRTLPAAPRPPVRVSPIRRRPTTTRPTTSPVLWLCYPRVYQRWRKTSMKRACFSRPSRPRPPPTKSVCATIVSKNKYQKFRVHGLCRGSRMRFR